MWMLAIQLHGRPIESIFELLGSDENAMTYALGWCMARVPGLTAVISAELGLDGPGETPTVLLQEHVGGKGITDVEIRDPGKVAWIFEAKVGFAPPGVEQLARYAKRLHEQDDTALKMLIVVAQSDRRDLTLNMRVPKAVDGIAVKVLSWGQINTCLTKAYPGSDNTGKALLRQFSAFLTKVLEMQNVNSNNVYVVSVSRDTFGGGSTTFIDVVDKFKKYFHPVGPGWPASPPNHIAFRWGGQVQSVHHIDDFEIISQFASYFPGTSEEGIQPHFLYHLGPAITPNRTVKTGNLFRAARIYAHIDLLLTSETIAEAGVKTRERLEKASKS